MRNQDYKWKRFWCPRSGCIHLADGGYLYDPEAKWGKIYNPDLVTFKTISNLPCLALLGEPGIGKTHALETEQKETISETRKQGGQVLLLDIRSFGSEDRLIRRLFDSQEFTEWLKGTYNLHIFLDSFDECLLRIDTLATLLVDEFKLYQGHIKRLYLRINCRTSVWQPVLEEGLKEIWGQDSVGVYELAPLRYVDVEEAAKIEGIDSTEKFLEEIQRKNVVSLAIKPITLKFLIASYVRNQGQFPPEQKLHEFYLEGCKWLCEERNDSRIASKQTGNLSPRQRLIIAGRIAAITIFANRVAIWTDIDRGDIPDEDIDIQRICHQVSERIDGIELEISKAFVEEVLDTGLFSSRGLNRMGWAHQTYAEFLAAWYLVQRHVSLHQVMDLIILPEHPERKIIPNFYETAAWLASIRHDVLQEIMKTDPDVLLRSDIPSDENIRAAIVENLLKQHEHGRIYYDEHYHLGYESTKQGYNKLNHDGLPDKLRPYIQDSSKPIDARNTAIDIAEACELNELQEELVNLVLDSSESIHLRDSAARAICTVGNVNTRLRLKHLVFQKLPEDEYDQLKGYVLRTLWSDHLTAEELFDNITPPKRRNFTGSYRVFLDYELVLKLKPTDLIIALKWLEKQGLRCFGHPFERLADLILINAWEYFNLPEVAKSFTKVALIQWREHQRTITSDNQLQIQFQKLVIDEVNKRRELINNAVITISELRQDPGFLLSSLTEDNITRIIQEEDVFWMLGKLQNVDSKEERIWAALIQWSFDRQDARQIDAILTATKSNEILKVKFAYYFSTIDLDSTQAKNLRKNYQRMEVQQNRAQKPFLDPPPQERIVLLLEQIDSGNISAWCQLNMEMTLKPDSQFYEQELELDLTKLPGWQEADLGTRNRIINAAKKYIQEYNQLVETWVGTNTFDRADLAGCRALHLLLKEDPEIIQTLSSEIWQRWASVIVGFPYDSREKYYIELVRLSYINAPTKTLNTLLSIIDKENGENSYICILNKFDTCWDNRLKTAILDKAKQASIKPECMRQLLRELLKHKSVEARDFAQSLVSVIPDSTEDTYQKAVAAATVLVEYAEPISWKVVWLAIQQNTVFARAVFEAVVGGGWYGIHLNISEDQLANLYIWLVNQYPHAEDPDYSNEVLAHAVGNRESIAKLRDNLLRQLQQTGTTQACIEIGRIAEQFPELTWLKRTLLTARSVMRRETWQPLQPEQILQIVSQKELQTAQIILILASNPEDTRRLRIDKEACQIEQSLRRSQNQVQYKLEQRWAVGTSDFRQALLDLNPKIVHFCGHGSGEGLIVEDENGQSKFLTTEALANLFKACAEHIECVILSACYSEVQAKEIAKYIDYVIGMSDKLEDKSAIEFAKGFYDALAAGRSIENAYEIGNNAIQLENIPGYLTPKLYVKEKN